MTYEIIKRNFDRKLWDKAMVAVAVAKGKITEEQYKENREAEDEFQQRGAFRIVPQRMFPSHFPASSE